VSLAVSLALLALIVFASALCSGGEIGMYSMSRPQMEAEAAAGGRTARLLHSLVRHESWLLATLLIANNLTHQAATFVSEAALAPFGVPATWMEFAIAVLVTPPMLLFGELLPKDLFRRRPNVLTAWCAPFLYACRALLAPLAFPLQLLTSGVARWLGFDSGELARVRGREAVIDLLRERESELSPQVERLARNVLELRSVRVERVMVPWLSVECARLAAEPNALRLQMGISPFSRLPVVDERGAVRGYIHQLEVLGQPASSAERHLRPLLEMAPDTPLDRALARLKQTGQRAALVGDAARPLGLVTLKDLVEEISGELARW
jgi:putative hemolysin